MLSLDHVSKMYGNHVGVKDLSFSAKSGSIVGILGSNGSGKTTTFRMLLGLIEKTSGTITYDGKELDLHNQRLFGYLPEERSMLRDLKVKDQIIYLAKLKKMTMSEINESLDYWLEYLKIEQYRNRRIIELSKGNQQKTQLICALIHDPKIYIFDEPLNGLDLDNVDLFKELCLKLKKAGKIILISSHQYNNIEELCDSVVYLYQGDCLFKGQLNRLKQKKAVRYITIDHSSIEDWEDEAGVISIKGDSQRLVIETSNEESAQRLVKRCLKLGIHSFRCEMISLQRLIKEALDERTR